jgi:hypothetical protein
MDKRSPWQPGEVAEGEGQAEHINGSPSTLNANQSLAVELMAELGFKDFTPPALNPVAERAYSQLTFEQLVQAPRLIVRHKPWASLKEVARDCQVFANKYREACFIADPEGRVLVYREPQGN